MQCMICGRQVGGEKSIRNRNLNEIPPFNEKINIEIEKSLQKRVDSFRKKKFYYVLYEKIKEKNNYSDEMMYGLLKSMLSLATEAKIKTIEESKFCKLNNEPKLTEWLIKFLDRDFHIRSELKGKYILTKKNVKVDLMLYPKEHLIECGFDKDYFAIEIKYLDPFHELFKKGSEMFWQAITYKDSAFEIKNKTIIPKFTLVFTNLSFKNQRKKLLSRVDWDMPSMWRAYSHLASHAGVGILEILEPYIDYKTKEKSQTGWKIFFATSEYFTKDREGNYKLNNPYVSRKKSAGNIS
ncbi:hypothetical protein AMRN_1218 [Malaciobacter marinus]|uniref:Uncharacterized protein n=1 Tax=Malaciobacter marinus TaxID=505249 RepID=A0A347TK33_9BACT|nr:hypothetical protein [Malaciobacter marinus]AXX86961.1 hypothetical protein AMRN_1218 [Malaciobacter marinus]PHO14021.1 hypothetical protein CPH92_14115 [Malaciobacter marinus]